MSEENSQSINDALSEPTGTSIDISAGKSDNGPAGASQDMPALPTGESLSNSGTASATEQTSASLNASENSQASGDQPTKVPRLGFGQNVSEALNHVKKSVDSKGSNVRASDKLSAWLIPITCVGLMAAALNFGWARIAILILCLIALFYYVLSRIGIMRALSERQAALIWHILKGTFLLGIVFTFVFLEIVNQAH